MNYCNTCDKPLLSFIEDAHDLCEFHIIIEYCYNKYKITRCNVCDIVSLAGLFTNTCQGCMENQRWMEEFNNEEEEEIDYDW